MIDKKSDLKFVCQDVAVVENVSLYVEQRAKIEKLTTQCDDLLREVDSFQCDIASALGWEADGRPFAELVRELYVSYWQPTN